MSSVDITGLPREAVLAALYNAATPRGMGFSHYDARPMDAAQALRVINERGNDLLHMVHKLNPGIFPAPKPRLTLAFDYVYGRPLKVHLVSERIDARFYDEIHGEGRAQLVVDILRSSGDPADDRIMALHHASLRREAEREWDDLPPPYREEVLASHRRGERPDGSMDHVIADILFPTVN